MNVLITGATKGMGRAIAQKFADSGHNVIACSRTATDLSEMSEAFANCPGTLYTRVVDIGKSAHIAQLVQWLQETEVKIDVLINNAGFYVPGALHTETEDTMLQMMEVNFFGAYRLTKALLPGMMARKQGHIFNICSVASFTAMANVGSYGVSKFALYGFTKNLREEMKPYGIKVTAISPGATFTSSWQGADIDPERLVASTDIAALVLVASQLSPGANVDDIVIRPQKGDV